MLAGRAPQPTAVILDRRTVQSTPENGARAGYDGAKRRKGSTTHRAVDTLGYLLTAYGPAADAQGRAQVAQLTRAVQAITGETVEVGYVDQGDTGAAPAVAAAAHGIALEVVNLPEAKRGFVLLPRRWVAERSFGGLARCRQWARDYARLADTVEGLTVVAFACLMRHRLVPAFSS